MKNCNIKLPKHYLLPEVRNDYNILSGIKLLWAYEMDLLVQFSGICAEHNLSWFVANGTLLGAARHQGYIPWDMDIDIVMPREDYEKFLKVAKFESPYFLQTFETEGRQVSLSAKLRNSETTMHTSEIPLNNVITNEGIFIDIYPLDLVPEDMEERLAFYQNIKELRLKAIIERNNAISHCITSEHDDDIKVLVKDCVDAMSSYSGETEILCNIPLSMENRFENELVYQLEDFSETVMLPFEFLTVPAPKNYRMILEAQYGVDWETPVKKKGTHSVIDFSTRKPYHEL